jgi:hypothetical protein
MAIGPCPPGSRLFLDSEMNWDGPGKPMAVGNGLWDVVLFGNGMLGRELKTTELRLEKSTK